jgi:Transcriptional regulators containing a DNA-binding HTH domain and an aminotransferase domain (MocR family) and their eukaryotic orthologs
MSWKPDRSLLERPIYLSLAALLEQDIVNGFLAPDTKLPPQRELADFLDINFTTVTRVYKRCELKGLVYAVTGSGTYVSPNAARSITISKTSSERIDLAFVASFEQCNSVAARTLKKIMQKKYLEQLLSYDDPTGMAHHKAAGINWMERFGVTVAPENMAIASGTLNAITVTLMGLFSPGDRIAVDYYTFSNFIELAKLYNVQLVPVESDDEGMLADELDYQCRLADVKGVFLMPSCCNPTTVMMSDRRKGEIAEVIAKHGLLLIEDDLYAFLTAGIVKDYKRAFFNIIPENTIYLCGTSKSICSGLRVAYLAFAEKYKQRIERAIFNINVKTSSLDAEVITEMILSGAADEVIGEKRKLAKTANALFYEYFPDAPKTGHPLAFFRWLPLPEHAAGREIEKTLQDRGVGVYHSERFLCGRAMPDKYLRVALASTPTLGKLRVGLEIMESVLTVRKGKRKVKK